jgi:hypothetical protein
MPRASAPHSGRRRAGKATGPCQGEYVCPWGMKTIWERPDLPTLVGNLAWWDVYQKRSADPSIYLFSDHYLSYMTRNQSLGQYSGVASITTFRVQPGISSSGSSNAQAASSSTSPFVPGVPTTPPPPRASPFGVLGAGTGVPSLEFGLEFDSACNLAWS